MENRVDDRLRVNIILVCKMFYGDALTRIRVHCSQLDTDETFLYYAIRAAYADWHALRVWDLKQYAAKYLKCQVGEAGTLAWLTNELNLLRQVPPEKEQHYDRLREHMESLGIAHVVALFRYVMSMPEASTTPALSFPPWLDPKSKADVRAFAIAVGEWIVQNHVLPYGNVDCIGLTPRKPYACSICQEGFLYRAAREKHEMDCLSRRQENGLGIVLATSGSVTVQDFHGDVIWSTLFRKEFAERTAIGDGHRISRVLSKYQLLLYEGSHSTSMVREVLRLLTQTDTEHGLYSPAMATRVMYDRYVNLRGYNEALDIVNEQQNRKHKPSLARLRPNHSVKDAQKAYARGSFFAMFRERFTVSFNLAKQKATKRRSRRRRIVSLAPNMLLGLNIFTAPRARTYKSIVQSASYNVNPMSQVSFQRLRTTANSVHSTDFTWGTRLRRRQSDNKELLQEFQRQNRKCA
jgi:hypothetical protein